MKLILNIGSISKEKITHKECIRCKIFKSIDCFGISNLFKTKRHYYCKLCRVELAQELYKKKVLNPEWVEERNINSIGKSKECKTVYKKRNYKENPEKVLAHCSVYKAIKRGDLIKMPCEICGELKVQAHHEDYNKRLEVKWLCVKHHNELHRKYNYK